MSASRPDAENLSIGLISAPIFTVITQPTVYLKHARMQGLPLTLNPRLLWSGTLASVCNETGQAGLQFLAAGMIKKLVRGDSRRELTALEDMSSAAAAGAVAAVYVSPVELVMIQQQRFGGSIMESCSRMRQSFGLQGFARGYVATALRDCVYVVGMLSATPILEDRSKKLFGLGPTAGGLLSSCAAGIAAGILSCPLDCVKACMKGDMERSRYGSFLETSRLLYKSGGLGRFFNGVEWRCACLSGGFFIVTLMTRAWDNSLKYYAFEGSRRSDDASFVHLTSRAVPGLQLT